MIFTATKRVILGVDPGGTTGLALLVDDTMTHAELQPMATMAFIESVSQTAHDQDVRFTMSVEQFTPTGRGAKTVQTDALKIIGAARFTASRCGARFMLNEISSAQRVGSPEILRKLGWWVPGKDHCNKAASQVAYALMRTEPYTFASLTLDE